MSLGYFESDMDKRDVERDVENTAVNIHLENTKNLLYYTLLLIFTFVVMYTVKKYRFTYVRETGLTLIFGFIVGEIMKLTGRDSCPVTVVWAHNLSANFTLNNLPDTTLLLRTNTTKLYRYSFDFGQYKTTSESKATFDSEIFLGILLPIIIFNAGYSLKKRNFFRNLGTILTFSIIGTTISSAIIGLIMYGISIAANLSFSLAELLWFGAIISATDPVSVLAIFNDINVDADLFAILFGESVLNNAVAIVLSGIVARFATPVNGLLEPITVANVTRNCGLFVGVFFGSMAIGIVVGWIAAFLTKFTKISDHPLLETTFFILSSYMSFLVTEYVGLASIVAILFCGICQAHYTYNNLSKESQKTTKDFLEILTFLCETFIFAYIGVSMFTSSAHKFNVWFILGSFVTIFVARAIYIYPLSFLLNVRRKPKIPCNYQHMIFFAGLRGAVAFALAVRNTSSVNKQILYTTTSLIVIFTVLVNGGLAVKMISWLQLKRDVDSEIEMQSNRYETSPDYLDDVNCDENANTNRYNPWDKAFFPRQWYNLDAKFFKPLLTHYQPSLIDTMPRCCFYFAKWFTSQEQIRQRLHTGSDSVISPDITTMDDDLSNCFDATDDGHTIYGNLQIR